MNYYKILNEEENHRGLQYKTGLNIDPVEFNPYGNCQPGGIYFASKDILGFLSHGPWIRKVTIPEDAQIYKNPKPPEKWKADKVILEERRRIDIEVIQELIDEGADPKADNSIALRWAVGNGYLEIVELLIKRGADPKTDNSWPLQIATECDHRGIIKELIPISDLKANDSYVLKWAAVNGYFDIAKLSIDNGADPKASNNYSLKSSAMNEHLEIVKLLIPLLDIDENIKNWAEENCKNQEIKNLILSYKKEQ